MKNIWSKSSILLIGSLFSLMASAASTPVPWATTSVSVGSVTADLEVYSSEEVPSVCAILNLKKDNTLIDSKGLCQLTFDTNKKIDLASEVSDFSFTEPIASENKISFQVEYYSRVGVIQTNLNCVIEVSEQGATLPICNSVK